MIADPLGLGELLYGFRVGRGLTAAAWVVGNLAEREFDLAHEPCSISTFCKNPLHPGPCKGWKKKLGVEAPGALNAIEKAHKEKVHAKRKATAEAKSTASKNLTGRQLASPLHAKKATIKHANVLLGDDEAKADKKAGRVILNKTEIKKYSKIKSAQMNALRAKHGLTEDPGLEDRIADSLATDNLLGKDDTYRNEIGNSGFHLGAQLAEKHCKKGDGDCDGEAFESLREALVMAARGALTTGDDEQLDKILADYKAGKFKPDVGPKGLKAFDKASNEDKAMDVLDGITKADFDQWPESAQADAEQIVMLNSTPQAEGLKKKLGFKDKAPALPPGVAEVNTWFPENQSMQPGPLDADRLNALQQLGPDEFDALPLWQKSAIALFLGLQEEGPNAGKAASLQAKFGIGSPPAPPADLPVVDAEPDVLQQLLDGVPDAGGFSAPSPTVQAATDYATGAKGGTLTKKVAAYEKLTPEEFADLPKVTQDLIVADLKQAKDKFLAPAKKSAVQQLLDDFSPATGGGAGAGGSTPGAVNPAAKSNAQKAADGGEFGAEVEVILNPAAATKEAEVADSWKKVLESAHDKGTADKVAGVLADDHAKVALNKLSWMHEDPFGNPLMDPAAKTELEGLLAAELKKAYLGGDDATPIFDAWKKAIYSGDPGDAQLFSDVAVGYTGGDATPGAPSIGGTMQQKSDLKAALSFAWLDAGMGTPLSNAPSNADMEAAAATALANGFGSAEHLDWAKKTGMVLGINAMNGMFNKVGLDASDVSAVPPALMMKANLQLNQEFGKALADAKPLTSDSFLSELGEIAEKVKEDGYKMALHLGVAADHPTIKEYKRDLLHARLESALAKYPSGAGGSTSAPNPGSAAAPAVATPPKPKKTAAGKVKLGTGSASTFTPEQQQIITGTVKANNVNLSSSSEADWDVLVATAKAQAGKDGLPKTLTVMDVLNAVDAGHAKNLGVTNSGALRDKVLKWLGTASGKAYAEANSTPKPDLIQQMTGPLSIKLPAGKKVQTVKGPGKYQPSYVPNAGTPNAGAWKKQTWQEADAYQEQYWKDNPGTKWTPEQVSSLHSYTLGSGTINDYLRGETSSGTPVTTASTSTKQAIINIQSAMVPLAEDTQLARGSGWEMFPPGFRDYEGVKKLIGKNITDKAFLSTSVTGGGSQGFSSKPVRLDIEAPAGTHGAMVEKISAFKGGSEQEMLLPAGTVLRILSVTPEGSGVRVRARVVTPK